MQKIVGLWVLFPLVVLSCSCARIRPPDDVKPLTRVLLATGYCKCGTCCGWRRTWYGRPVYSGGSLKGKRKEIGATASGAQAQKGKIAADTSKYPFGTIMYIEGYGYGRVEDRGGAIKGEHIDLYFSSHKKAQNWGKKKLNVKIWRPKKR